MLTWLDAIWGIFRRKQSLLPKKPVKSVEPSCAPQQEGSLFLGLHSKKPDFSLGNCPRWFIQTEVEGRYVARRVEAWTRSEARSQVKKEFGLSRLPVGALIERA